MEDSIEELEAELSTKKKANSASEAYRAERIAWFQSNRDSPYMPKIFATVEAGQPLDFEEEYA